MTKTCRLFVACLFVIALFAHADTVILHDGTSYSGQLSNSSTINFTDSQGIQYQFPRHDVQSVVFTSGNDIVTLRNGTVHAGHFATSGPIHFEDWQGVKYEFPQQDIESIVLSNAGAPVTEVGPQSQAGDRVIPRDAEISVRTNENIDSETATQGQLYSAEITEDVTDVNGGIAIKKHSLAKLVIRSITTGGAVHSPELVLDLYSVTADGKEYRVVSSDVDENNRKGFGKNKRTAEMLGGGAAIGALLGGIFGGGKGAGIGAAAGGGGGFLTQVFTRGTKVRVPAESVLRFRLLRTLVLRP